MLSMPLTTSLLVSALSMTGWKPDLVNRTAVIEPAPLPAEGKLDDEELARRQHEVAPRLMGAVLKLVGMVSVDKRPRDWSAFRTHRVVGWGRTVAILDDIFGTTAHAEMMVANDDSLAAQPVAPWVESLVSWAVQYPDATHERRLTELRQFYAANTARPFHPPDDEMQPDRRELPGSDRAAADMLTQAEGVLSAMGVHIEKKHFKQGNLWSIVVDDDSVSEIRARLSLPIHEVDRALLDDVEAEMALNLDAIHDDVFDAADVQRDALALLGTPPWASSALGAHATRRALRCLGIAGPGRLESRRDRAR